ncbi:small RNA 2'-O-methyltransferase [Aulostomus maculatus]
MNPLFSPPLHRQRHQFVIDFVKKNKPKRVADLGCGECSLLRNLRFHREIELLVGVDVDGAQLKEHMYRLAPISTNYLQPGYDQLHVDLYQGSVTVADCRLRGFDLVTCIELIEHLPLTDVELFSGVVFGYMAPLAAIVSTPNSEYNPLLPGLTGFRHNDHKFEWTRAEFQSWAVRVCVEYGFQVEFTGVGRAPPGLQESVGFCSQIAVFHRLGGNTLCGDDVEDVLSYTRLYSVTYPSLRDNNILRRVLVSEVLYEAEKLTREWMENQTAGSPGGQAEGGEEPRIQAFKEPPEKSEENNPEDEEAGRGGPRDEGEREAPFWRCCSSSPSLVSVPLDVLWSCCPKISKLSGSLINLRHLIMDDPQIKLSQDGAAVMVRILEAEEEEALDDGDDDDYLQDSRHVEASCCSYSAGKEEDWEANV